MNKGIGMAMALGVAIGAAIGAATHNMAWWVAAGAGIGGVSVLVFNLVKRKPN
jgi:hypothetical protein